MNLLFISPCCPLDLAVFSRWRVNHNTGSQGLMGASLFLALNSMQSSVGSSHIVTCRPVEVYLDLYSSVKMPVRLDRQLRVQMRLTLNNICKLKIVNTALLIKRFWALVLGVVMLYFTLCSDFLCCSTLSTSELCVYLCVVFASPQETLSKTYLSIGRGNYSTNSSIPLSQSCVWAVLKSWQCRSWDHVFSNYNQFG